MDGKGSPAFQGKHETAAISSLHSPMVEVLTLLQEALQLSSPVISKYPDQIASQLTGRLLTAKNEGVLDLLSQIRSTDRFWLRPITPSLYQAGGALLKTLVGHTKDINKIAVTPDDRYAISASDDGTLKLWNLRTGLDLHTFEGHYPVHNAAIACGGQRLIASMRGHEVKVWDIASGSELWSMTCDAGGVAATPGSTLAVLATGINLLVIDLASFEVKFTLSGHEQFIETVTISKDGLLAASGTDEGNIIVWDLKWMRQYRSFNYSGFIYDLSFTPDNRYFLSVGDDFYAKLWDLKNSQEARRFNLDYPQKVRLTGDGQVAIFASQEGISSWDIQTGKMISLLLSDADLFKDIQLSATERYLLTASSDHTIRVWRLDQLGKSPLFPGHEHRNTQVRFSADGQRGISWGDVSIKVWDLENFIPTFEFSDEYRHVKEIKVTLDGRYGFLLLEEDMILFDLKEGKFLADLHAYKGGYIEGVEVTPDCSRVLVVYGSYRRSGNLSREYLRSNWLCIWEINLIEGSNGEEDLPRHNDFTDIGWLTNTDPDDEEKVPEIYPVAECKLPQPPKTKMPHGLEDNPDWSITYVPEEDGADWSVLDPQSGQKLGELGSYLRWPTSLLDVPGLIKEPVVEPVDEHFNIEINKAGHLVIEDRSTGQMPAVFTCEGRVNSFDLHPDHRIIIVGDQKGRVYFLRIEGHLPQLESNSGFGARS